MKVSKYAAIGLVLAAGTALVVAQDDPATKPQEKAAAPIPDLKPKASYILGHSFGKNFRDQEVDLDVDALLKGVRDGIAGAQPEMSEAEVEQVMNAFRDQFVAQQTARMEAIAAKNLKEGQDFLAQNKTKEGVKTTESGLQYQILEPGTGPSPRATDTVKVHYRGTLIDGTEFDSSYKRGEPIEFPLNRVIPGWTEGLQLMKAGGKGRLFIPSELAYRDRAQGDEIGPNSVLIFDIELLDVTPAQAPAGAPGAAPRPAAPKAAQPKPAAPKAAAPKAANPR